MNHFDDEYAHPYGCDDDEPLGGPIAIGLAALAFWLVVGGVIWWVCR